MASSIDVTKFVSIGSTAAPVKLFDAVIEGWLECLSLNPHG